MEQARGDDGALRDAAAGTTEPMRTYFDQNRLGPETDRRFHACDLERVGGYVQIVPTVVEQMAPLVDVGTWGRNEARLLEQAAEAERAGDSLRKKGLDQQRWWNSQWRQTDGLYRIDRMSREEHALVENLLGPDGFAPECFPDARGPLDEHNDAKIVAQVVARGGTMPITSDTTIVDEVELARWHAGEGKRWNLKVENIVYDVDSLFTGWAKHPECGDSFVRTALGAFWPEDPRAGINIVREAVEAGVEALAQGQMPRFGKHLKAKIERHRDIRRLVEETRRQLPERTRGAERERRDMLEEDRSETGREKFTRAQPERRMPKGYE